MYAYVSMCVTHTHALHYTYTCLHTDAPRHASTRCMHMQTHTLHMDERTLHTLTYTKDAHVHICMCVTQPSYAIHSGRTRAHGRQGNTSL